MRRTSIFFALFLAGCSPVVSFSTELKGESVVAGSALPAVLNVFPAFGNFSNLDFDQNQDFKNEKVTRDRVTSATVELLQLKILSPSNQDFSFLDNVQFAARTGDTEKVFAEKSNISDLKLSPPNPTLTLDLPPAQLAPFVQAETMSIVMRGRGRQPPQDTRIEAKVKLRVEAKVF